MFSSLGSASTLYMTVPAFSLNAALAATTVTPHQRPAPSTCALFDRAATDGEKLKICRWGTRWPGFGHVPKDGSGDAQSVQAAEAH